MRFVKEMLNQMVQDVNKLVGGYGAITAYILATLAVITLTILLISGIDFSNTGAGRAWSALTYIVALFGEVLLAFWLWDAGSKAKKKIAEENEELMRTLKADPETYR